MLSDTPSPMKLSGYVPLSERGFALATYARADVIGNAEYCAIPAIEGDRLTSIAAFDNFEGPAATSLNDEIQVEIGSPWIDVFLWDNREFLGTPTNLFVALEGHHDEIAAEAPLTYLDLGLAANAPDTPIAARDAREFLRRRLGEGGGERSFREVVVRPGVALEVRRCLHSHKQPLPYGGEVGFDVLRGEQDVFRIALDGETLRRLGAVQAFDELREAVERFAGKVGLRIDVLEPPPPPISEAPTPVPEVLERDESLGGRVAIGARQFRSRLFGLAREMAVDLGTNNTRIYARGRGLVLSEPSAISMRTLAGVRRVMAVGDEAKLAIDRTPEGVEVIRPLRGGVITDLDAATAMLAQFIRRVRPGGLRRRPLDLMICPPSGSTSLERRALRQAALKAGASKVWLVEAPLAAAVGADLPVDEPIGSMILQIGGGTTEIAVAALRGLAYITSVRVGGDTMDEAIVNYARRDRNLLIGIRSAESIKHEIGAARSPAQGLGAVAQLRGRDLINGVPKEIEVSTAWIAAAIAEPVGVIVEAVRIALENTAPELAADIIDSGIVVAGGGALLRELDEVLKYETGLPVRIAPHPSECVTIGLARMLEDDGWRKKLQR